MTIVSYSRNDNNSDDNPLIVDCDVTLVIKKRVKMKVCDYDVEEYEDYNGNYNKSVDISSIDWDDVIYDNELTPDSWELVESEVTPIQW